MKEKKEIKKCKWEEKAEEYLSGWRRAQADYQNREREIAEEKRALRGLVEEYTVTDFLPILDNLKKAIHEVEENNWVKGVQYVIKQFEDKLSALGIEKIELLGKEFNTKFAEAVESRGDGNNVIEVLVDGYAKGERVIRAGRVIVG